MTDADDLPMAVEGLPLPSALVALLREGRWCAPDEEMLQAVFPERPIFPSFYAVESIVGVNRGWCSERREEFVCHPDAQRPPGDIDPRRSLLIGDLGPDQIFALDYRDSLDAPRVVYLAEEGWVEVAPDFETFAGRLGL
jgi:hypothetical protein